MNTHRLNSILVAGLLMATINWAPGAFAEDQMRNSSTAFMTEVVDEAAQKKSAQQEAAKRAEVEWKLKEQEYQERLADLERQNIELQQRANANAVSGTVSIERRVRRDPVSGIFHAVAGTANAAMYAAGAMGSSVTISGYPITTYPTVLPSVAIPGYYSPYGTVLVQPNVCRRGYGSVRLF